MGFNKSSEDLYSVTYSDTELTNEGTVAEAAILGRALRQARRRLRRLPQRVVNATREGINVVADLGQAGADFVTNVGQAGLDVVTNTAGVLTVIANTVDRQAVEYAQSLEKLKKQQVRKLG